MAHPRGRLIIVCGLPGAGKTTVAARLAGLHGGTRFSPDDWMEALAINLWDADARDRIERLQWSLARDIIRLGGTAIIEWGTWGRDERDRLRNEARDLGAAVELVYLSAPVDTLFDRVRQRGRENPPMTREMLAASAAAIQPPTPEELALYDPPAKVPS